MCTIKRRVCVCACVCTCCSLHTMLLHVGAPVFLKSRQGTLGGTWGISGRTSPALSLPGPAHTRLPGKRIRFCTKVSLRPEIPAGREVCLPWPQTPGVSQPHDPRKGTSPLQRSHHSSVPPACQAPCQLGGPQGLFSGNSRLQLALSSLGTQAVRSALLGLHSQVMGL